MTSTPASGLEFAARYTHQWADGRTETVTLIHHETPGDREWAVARVAEMVRAQEAFASRPVDAHLLVRRAATEWRPEELTEQQRNGWACIVCGAEDTESIAMAPAGFADGRQLFRCAADCGPTPDSARHAQRGDAVEVWIKAKRDEHARDTGYWWGLDRLLDEYRLHADYGTPLDKELSDSAS